MVPARPVLSTFASQHAEEAAVLWGLRRQAVRRPDYNLEDLAKLEGRVEAHLDGLRIAGEVGWSIAIENLGLLGDDSELFVTTVLAVSAGPPRLQGLFDALADKPELGSGLVSALGWLPWESARGLAATLLHSEDQRFARLGLRSYAISRQHPGPALEAALHSRDPILAAYAARAVGELGGVELLPVLETLLGATNEQLRFWGAWAAVVLGSRSALPVLIAIAEQEGPFAERATLTAARALQPSQTGPWLAQMFSDPKRTRRSLMAAGAAGDPVVIPQLLNIMAEPELARVAAEALSAVTGVDLALQDLEGKAPENFTSGPNDDPEDENVTPDPDEDLPWPNLDLIAGWWRKNGPKFATGKRYLAGHPVTKENLTIVLTQAKQRQRLAAAELLMLMSPKRQPMRPLFECRATAIQQKTGLASMKMM